MVHWQKFQQVWVLSGLMLCTITDGFIIGQMSGMIDTLKSKDSDIPLTDAQVSWISSTINITCVCGFFLATAISKIFGRPNSVTVMCMPIIAIWIIVYYAKSFTTLMITRILIGMCYGGILIYSVILSAEYSAPNVRCIYLNLVTAGGTALGTMLGHILCIFFHWRTVALLGVIPTSLAALLPFFWVESPSWLASKGRFKECEISFRALHGDSKDAENELRLLIELEMDKQEKAQNNKTLFFDVKKMKSAMTKKYFWKLACITNLIHVYRVIAGKVLFGTLAITMLQEITKNSDILMFTLLVDGFAVVGGFSSCYFVSKMKMRTLLFSSAIIANVFLSCLSACMYFSSENNIYVTWLNCLLLALYFITINAGPYPTLEALLGEIYPLEIKCECFFIFGVISSLMHFLYIQYAPSMLYTLGYPGAFVLNCVIMFACLLYFWVVLPETKGRTLQELEMYFKNDRTFEKICVEQEKNLI